MLTGRKQCSFTAIAPLCLLLFTPLTGLAAEPAASLSAWDAWGGDAQGRRYAPVDQITPDNVSRLVERKSVGTKFGFDNLQAVYGC